LDNEEKNLLSRFIQVLSTYRNIEDMLSIGAYVKGSNPEIDYAINMIDKVNHYLCQPVEEMNSIEKSAEALKALFP
jgi:flagellum-specific ATP synthase